MLHLRREGFAGLLVIASVILGLGGAQVLVGAVLLCFTGPADISAVSLLPLAGGAVAFAAGLGLMAWARRLSGLPVTTGAVTRTLRAPARALRLLLLLVSVVLIYMGGSMLLNLVIILAGHDPGYGALSQVGLGLGGVAMLALGIVAIVSVRHLQRR